MNHHRDKEKVALVLDVDGSLLKTDMLYESFWAALGRHPWLCLLAVFTLILDKPALKKRMAALSGLEISRLPMREEVVALVAEARHAGREVILASGSDQGLVLQMSARLGLSGAPMASDGQVNLTGKHKSAALEARFGAHGFEYVGDSAVDIPIWQKSVEGYVVAPGARLKRQIKKAGLDLAVLGKANRLSALWRSLRPHQWIKNILLFLPIIAAHRTDLTSFLYTLWGVAVFSLAASSIYIINDLLDLDADRQHQTKRHRPFAAGQASIRAGMLTFVLLAGLALGGAGLHSISLGAIIALYMALSLSYSMGLKKLRWVDVSALAALYTLRVVAGSVAAGVAMSGWLGAFVFPVFLALGAVKRLVELGKTDSEEDLPGRGYARRDRADLRNIAITAAVAALVVYLLYSYSEIASVLYQNPFSIRLAAVPLALWLARMIQRGWQGRMDYDPIAFALRDPIGLALMAIGAWIMLFAAG